MSTAHTSITTIIIIYRKRAKGEYNTIISRTNNSRQRAGKRKDEPAQLKKCD